MNRRLSFFIAVLSLLLAACGGPAAAKSVGDANQGKTLFTQATIREAPGCGTCHSVEPGKVLVGPSLAGVAARAGERVSGKSAIDYLRECITTPNAYVVEGFTPGVMYQNFEQVLTTDEINNLVAYLLTLE